MKLPDPIAYFDAQERGFYWAMPIGVFAPTTVTVPPLALYLESALAEVRRAALQEAANVCDDLRQPRGWSAESNDWIEGTEDCAAAIRALIEKEKK